MGQLLLLLFVGTVFCLSIVESAVAQKTIQSEVNPEVANSESWTKETAGKAILHWEVSPPILQLDLKRFPAVEEPWLAIKDPSVVYHDSRWHLFCTIRRGGDDDGRIRIGYTQFSDWKMAQDSDWKLLELTMGYHGAPQVFYFEPHKKWYLIYQAEDASRNLAYGPCFSTTENINDPTRWTLPEPLYVVNDGQKAGLDFWVICDSNKAHLFYTSLNGIMWRCETLLKDFPNHGWSKPVVALEGDIFEASHTYRIKNQQRYLTFVEAQNEGRRYFKAYQSRQLEGPWLPIADSRQTAFVSPKNVDNQSESWATSYSHGELLRSGENQNLEIDVDNLQMLFQGVEDANREGRSYGEIPWKLGLLKLKSAAGSTQSRNDE